MEIPKNKYNINFGNSIDLKGIELQNINFENAWFTSFDLTNSTITDCCFYKTDIQSVLLYKAHIKNVIIEKLINSTWFNVWDSLVENFKLKDKGEILQSFFCDTLFKSIEISKMGIYGSYWLDVYFLDTIIQNTKLELFSHDVAKGIFFNYSHYESDKKEFIFTNCQIIDTTIKLAGNWKILLFENTFIEDTTIEQQEGKPIIIPPLAEKNIFLNTKLKNVCFKNINLLNAIFFNCTFENIIFENCKLDSSLFSFLLRTGNCKFLFPSSSKCS